MTRRDDLARFVVEASYDQLPTDERDYLKVLLLDTIGCALGTIGYGPLPVLRALTDEWGGGAGRCTLIGGGSAAPDRAACYNTALTRYMDFMDGFATKDEACHPSDNLAGVLAASEHAQRDGRDLLTALAIAYETQCRLVEQAPVTHTGFDHTTQLAISDAAGAAKALGLDERQTANAIAISGTAHNSIRVDRTGRLSMWKGLASADVARGVMECTFLASHGITGPEEYFEGKYGYEEALSEKKVDTDWKLGKDDRIPRIFLKRFNAEIHAQSAIEGILELRAEKDLRGEDVDEVTVTTFRQGYSVIGGGHGDAWDVRDKNQADHSYPYLVAVALLDGQVRPEQFAPERVAQEDVQKLLRRVRVEKSWWMTQKYPDKWPVKVEIAMKDGAKHTVEKEDWDGFHTRKWDFARAKEKFDRLAARSCDEALREEIAGVVRRIEDHPVDELTKLLAKARPQKTAPALKAQSS